jgi:ACS family allantoate permease-like MFS transporter
MSEPEKTSHVAPHDSEKAAGFDAVGDQVGTILKHADRNDADEALQVLAEGEMIALTPEEEKKLLRKIDYNIMPLLCLVYGLNYLDKTTVSYASIMGLKVMRLSSWA